MYLYVCQTQVPHHYITDCQYVKLRFNSEFFKWKSHSTTNPLNNASWEEQNVTDQDGNISLRSTTNHVWYKALVSGCIEDCEVFAVGLKERPADLHSLAFVALLKVCVQCPWQIPNITGPCPTARAWSIYRNWFLVSEWNWFRFHCKNESHETAFLW